MKRIKEIIHGSSPYVLAALAIILLAFCSTSRAETHFAVGPTMNTNGFTDGAFVLINERFKKNYSILIGHYTEQNVYGKEWSDINIVGIERLVRPDWPGPLNRLTFGIGAVYVNKPSLFTTTELNFLLRVEYLVADSFWRFKDVSVGWAHISNAGSGEFEKIEHGLKGEFNEGLDGPYVGWRF